MRLIVNNVLELQEFLLRVFPRSRLLRSTDGRPLPRKGIAPTLDDLVQQLSFGNFAHLLPTTPPTDRKNRGTGSSTRDNRWIAGLDKAFPHLTRSRAKHWIGTFLMWLYPAYAVGQALDRLVRLRNRAGHHEQILAGNHGRLRRDMYELIRATAPGGVMAPSPVV